MKKIRREDGTSGGLLREDGASGRITRLRLTLRAVANATLSSLVLAIISQTINNSMAVISEKMVHPGGFEPPTARFVAEYSIQLSYGCIGIYYCTTGYFVSL